MGSSGQGMMPELGSRISLISKADIRYEGRLFTVDPQECTIALANVRSFGTEDRETAYPIMPQPTVYDYILFRGSDIKDIRVVNNVSIPNDPAIMQMHLPPQNQQPGFPPQQMPTIQGNPLNQFGSFANLQQGPPMSGPNHSQQPSQSQMLSPQQKQQPSSQQGSRSGTPNASRKSPTSETGVQTNENQRGGDDQGGRNKRNNNNNNNHHQRMQQQQQRERQDSGRMQDQENRGGYRNQRMQPQQRQQQQFQQQKHQRGGYSNRGYQGGSGRMRPPQNNYRGGIPNQQGNLQMKPNGQQKKTLKFENEFDFEKANSRFEEIRSEFSKLKVGEESKNPEQPQPAVNGEVEKKDDSGNETGADHEQENDDSGYDKTKSFFDNISCEANERSKGKNQRTDWRQERKLNTETFGLTMNRRGNFRGRGYYRNQYGRPMNNNYRSGGGMQQYNNNRNRNPQNGGNGRNFNQGQQQQSQNKQPSTAAAADK